MEYKYVYIHYIWFLKLSCKKRKKEKENTTHTVPWIFAEKKKTELYYIGILTVYHYGILPYIMTIFILKSIISITH